MNFSITCSSVASLLVSAALVTPALNAQAPVNHIITAESGSAPDGFRYVDPVTGVVTPVTEINSSFLGGATCVAVDNTDPNGLYTSAGGSFGGAPLWRLEMTGENYDLSTATSGVVPFFGSLQRMHYSQHGLLLTLSSVSDGLYRSTGVGAPLVSLTSLTKATDIAVLGDMVYVNSFVSGQPSTIIEYDMATNTVRTVGANFPTVRSLGTFGGTLLAGLENGEIQIVDTSANMLLPFMQVVSSSIIAIAEGDSAMNTYFATASGEVYDLNNPATPIYVSPHTLRDIDVNRNQQGQVRYGQGCAGFLGTPAMAFTGRPALGSSYSFEVTGALPGAVALLALGFQRADVDLTPLGYAGCTLLNDGLVLMTVITDVQGGASQPIAIPNQASLVGASILGQYFVFESGASPLAASNGLEAVIN